MMLLDRAVHRLFDIGLQTGIERASIRLDVALRPLRKKRHRISRARSTPVHPAKICTDAGRVEWPQRADDAIDPEQAERAAFVPHDRRIAKPHTVAGPARPTARRALAIPAKMPDDREFLR